jgi:hypothetical protein
MATFYSTEIERILDVVLPARPFTRRPRQSDMWFDSECRKAKQLTRRLERAFAAASRQATPPSTAQQLKFDLTKATAVAAAAKAAWYNQRRIYRQMRLQKSDAFWREKISSAQSDPRKLWQSVDILLGRGKPPASSLIDVETFSQFFANKTAKVRSRTAGKAPPVFSSVRPGVSLQKFFVTDNY